MSALDELLGALPDAARDLKINLGAVLGEEGLTPAQRWGVALASAFASRSPELAHALATSAPPEVGEATRDDARAAAALMAMNNVYYRFRHFTGKDAYQKAPARLRMTRMSKPASSKVDFELMSLAVSAINGCEVCVGSHEATLVGHGVTEERIHDAARIAAAVAGVAAGLATRPL